MSIVDLDEIVTTLDKIDESYRELLSIVETLARRNTVVDGCYPHHAFCPVCSGTPTRNLFDFVHADDCPQLRASDVMARR